MADGQRFQDRRVDQASVGIDPTCHVICHSTSHTLADGIIAIAID
jgi:hypothetical protein